MNNKDGVMKRLRDLEQRAKFPRQQADNNWQQQDDNLWMSSLDIIGELLSVVEHLAGDGQAAVGEQMQLACPSCHACVTVSYDVVAEAAVRCPACGETVLLSNPT